MSSKVIITHKECYEKFQELNLGNHSQIKRIKLTKCDVFKQIEDILDSFDVKTRQLPISEDEVLLWNTEKNKIIRSFSRMKEKIPTRKFLGVFYDSRNYPTLTTLTNTESTDPSFQVHLVSKR